MTGNRLVGRGGDKWAGGTDQARDQLYNHVATLNRSRAFAGAEWYVDETTSPMEIKQRSTRSMPADEPRVTAAEAREIVKRHPSEYGRAWCGALQQAEDAQRRREGRRGA